MKEKNDSIYFQLGQALVTMGHSPIYLSKDQIDMMLFVSKKEHIVFTISIEHDQNRLLLSEGALFERCNKIYNGTFCSSEISHCDYTNTDRLISQFKESIDFLIHESQEFVNEDEKVDYPEMKSGIVVEETSIAIEKFASDNQYTVINCADNRGR